jgi:Domain of unknown function DUF302
MYGISIKLKLGFDRVIEQVTSVLKAESFGVLSDIDVQAALNAKLGTHIPSYRILGAGNSAFVLQCGCSARQRRFDHHKLHASSGSDAADG